jgi:hypothetical protein
MYNGLKYDQMYDDASSEQLKFCMIQAPIQYGKFPKREELFTNPSDVVQISFVVSLCSEKHKLEIPAL